MAGKTKKKPRKAPLRSPTARTDREFEHVILKRFDDKDLILVWLDRFGFALMHEATHEKVKEATGRSFVNYRAVMDKDGRAYVCAPPRAGSGMKHLVVSHMVVDVKPGQHAKSRDGNNFDLRFENWDVKGKPKLTAKPEPP